MAGNDLGSLLGGGGQSGGGAGNILGALLGALGGGAQSAGGRSAGGSPLEALIGTLTRSGLADRTQSWVGTGDNQPVSGTQIADALPNETLDQVAQQAGVTPQQAADEIARSLPQAVDRLTPSGQLPPAGASLEDIIRQQQL
ncbi:YidB family protein [Streptomyces sp. NPDC006208]|uniref:YidB family protein n=1 Tax=Streptomyces sp. NPDC006208 TaxID=3156734 RepID=UPI0033AF8DBA